MALVKLDTSPNMEKLYNVTLKNAPLGQRAAVKELVDNSMDADAKRIEIVLPHLTQANRLRGYVVIDDGCGMDEKGLTQSFTFCTDAPHLAGATGKFGVGGTTAAFYLGKSKTTLTKTKNGPLLAAFQDLTKSADVFRRSPTAVEEEYFKENCGDYGTIIAIHTIEEAETVSAVVLKNRLVKDLASTYHLKMPALKLKIKTRNVETNKSAHYPIRAEDPMFWSDPTKTLWRKEKNYNYEGMPFTVKFIILPNTGRAGRSGDGLRSYEKQGIYACREGRVIVEGAAIKGWWRKRSLTNGGRAMVSFGSELDDAMKVSMFKDGFKPIQAIIDIVAADFKLFGSRVITHQKEGTAKETSEPVKDDQVQLDKLHEELGRFGGHIGAQRKSAHGKGTEVGRVPKKKSDSSSRGKTGKRTGKASSNASPRCSRILPEFKLMDFGKYNETPLWYEIGDENIVVQLNIRSPVYIDNYQPAPDRTKRAMQFEWCANALALYDTYTTDESEFELVKGFLNKAAITRLQLAKALDVAA